MRFYIAIFVFLLVFPVVEAIPSLNSYNIFGVFYNGTDYIFSPNGDGVYDTFNITLTASESAKFPQSIPRGIEIMDFTNTVVKFFFNNSFGGFIQKAWDGKTSLTGTPPASDGVYKINTTMQNSTGNKSTATLPFFVFIDTTKPQFSNYNSNNTTSDRNTTVNVTINESNLQRVILEFRSTNYTATSNNSDIFSFIILSGNYSANQTINYYWYANDSVGNFNKSLQQSFTISEENKSNNSAMKDSDPTENDSSANSSGNNSNSNEDSSRDSTTNVHIKTGSQAYTLSPLLDESSKNEAIKLESKSAPSRSNSYPAAIILSITALVLILSLAAAIFLANSKNNMHTRLQKSL